MLAILVEGLPSSEVLPIIPNCMLMAFCNEGPLWPMEDIVARANIVKSATDNYVVYHRHTALGIPEKVTKDKNDFFLNHFICSTLYGFLHIPFYLVGLGLFMFAIVLFMATSIDV